MHSSPVPQPDAKAPAGLAPEGQALQEVTVAVAGRPAGLGMSFEAFARGQLHIAVAAIAALLVMLGLLLVQVWRSQSDLADQRRLQDGLQRLSELRQRAEAAESALLTYQATGNAWLLSQVQPCAGRCLASEDLQQVLGSAEEEQTAAAVRITNWARRVDAALVQISSLAVPVTGPAVVTVTDAGAAASMLTDVAGIEEVLAAGRQLRLNLMSLEASLWQALARSQDSRGLDLTGQMMLGAALAGLVLLGYGLLLRRSSRLARASAHTEQALRELSLRDPLTGLPNRRALGLRLEHMIERAERHGGGPAVLVVDLEGFRQINELHGHAAADHALVEVAHRLLAALRKSDLSARIDGDEFVVLLDDPESPDTARAVAERLLLLLRAPVQLPAPLGAVELGASVGLAHYPACAHGAQALLDAATQACGAAKLAGRNRLFEAPATQRPAGAAASSPVVAGSAAGWAARPPAGRPLRDRV
ncbi:MAG: hypothetical protein RL722_1247 [Pseudomonadota bacterium]|jgi:diguanylate cyclase (GGDEF)-like protein